MGMDEKSDGAVAQSVEQRTENPCVPGSSPGGATSPQRKLGAFLLDFSYSIYFTTLANLPLAFTPSKTICNFLLMSLLKNSIRTLELFLLVNK